MAHAIISDQPGRERYLWLWFPVIAASVVVLYGRAIRRSNHIAEQSMLPPWIALPRVSDAATPLTFVMAPRSFRKQVNR